ncbi:MAG TPA: AAA family ATPase [Gaiellaceae bacterium]|nr:AAA family ATPase [Gaiellaceae bacterium]
MRSDTPVGREPELSRIDAFLDDTRAGLRALAITGPAGIGKTTVWAEGVRRAAGQDRRVLAARPSGAEAQLSFAGLGDLLEDVSVDVFAALTPLQRRALDGALLRADVEDAPLDARAVATGLLSLLRKLGAAGPVLVAVDDAQWLDSATSEALAFAVRRLEQVPVGVLVSVRVDGDRPDTFERAVPGQLREEITLSPPSVAALHDILERDLGVRFARPVLVRIVAACAGNPFYALEIARELTRTGVPVAGAPLPVPQEVHTLVRARLRRLPARTQEALLVAACLSRPHVSLVDVEGLTPAEEAGVVHVDRDGRIRFSHPLLASAVYDAASVGRKRRVHRALAEQVDDPEERARHLSLVTDEPDEAVAGALDEAAGRAASRGAAAAAAELARRALELTAEPQGEAGVRRALTLAHYLRDAGDSPNALALLEGCDPAWVQGDLRAELLLSHGEILWYERSADEGYAKLVEALAHARDPKLAARIHSEAAWLSHDGHPRRGIEHADAVLGLVDPEESPGIYSKALLFATYLRLITGQGADIEAFERGAALQQRNVEWDDASPVVGMWPLLMDDFVRSRAFYEAGLAASRGEGDELSVQGTLLRLVEIDCWTGDWARADQLADEGMELADRLGSQAFLGSTLFARAYVDAHLGRVDAARAAAERIVELFRGVEVQAVLGPWVLGFLALSLDDPPVANEHLSRAASILEALGQREPARFRLHPDLIEAVVQVGDLERAEQLLSALAERGRVAPRPWVLATAARGRGLLLSARGDLDAARAAMEEALDHHARLEMPFERARTLLVYGRLLRRRKERREARAALEEALGVFDHLGATLWAERARAELARVPVRRAPSELTATEATIAELAASGLTNRLIAERIFVSPKTVESNLARVYRKLGIRSRAELGRAIAELDRVKATADRAG